MPEQPTFDVTTQGGMTIAAFRPEIAQIDESVIEVVNRQLLELTVRLQKPELVLDLTAVNFFGSSFIETMFRVWKRLQSQPGAKFALCGLQPNCREVLEITHLDQLWPICESPAKAVAELNAKA